MYYFFKLYEIINFNCVNFVNYFKNMVILTEYKKMKVKFLILVIFGIYCVNSFSQQTSSYRDIEHTFTTAMDLYQKKLFGSAQKMFGQILVTQLQPEKVYYRDEAAYYYAMCAMELFNGDAEYQTQNYIETHPESYYNYDATFKMANYYFRNKKFKEAIEWYGKVDKDKLTSEQNSELNFKQGFAYYARKDYEMATKSFYEIKDKKDNFGTLALYFYSHLKYTNKQYQTALNGFLELEKVEQFKDIAPHYIFQIYYFQEKYNEVIDFSSKMLDSTGNTSSESAKIIGEAYYKTGYYNEAIPYLKNYEKTAEKLTDSDIYELGFAHYKSDDCENSINYLNKIKTKKDTISQYIAYTLASCYLKQNKKSEARRCFETASQMKYNDDIREDALFNFAQLSYELSISPFNEAVTAFNTYIEEYPNSARKNEAYDFMLNAFYSTKNYQQAIKTIEKMGKTRNSRVDAAYQRLSYFRGLELFTEQKYTQAISMFDNSLKYRQYDNKISALSYYWKAESNYRINKITEAISQYKEFVNSTASVSLEEYGRAHYNLGYAYFNKKEYSTANTWFRKYETIEKNAQSTTLNDALNRIGDCFFVAKDFSSAAAAYKKAAKMGIIAKDYSLYQLALSYGGLKQYKNKVAALEQLVNENPDSEYAGNSMFETGRTFQTFIQNNDSAKYYYESLMYNYPNSKMLKAALSSIASIYFNQKNYSKALETYKQVIAQYPNSEEANNANDMILNIYMEQNNAEEYIQFARNEGKVITQSQEDELLWTAAKKLYIEQKYQDAITALTKYLTTIPNAVNKVEANFYKAELHYYYKQYDQALPCYKVVADAPIGAYTEESAAKAASMLFDKQEWGTAYYYYDKLYTIAEIKSTKFIAALGKLRTSFNGKDYERVIVSAKNVIDNENSNEEQKREANYKMAKAYLAQNKDSQANAVFIVLSKEVLSYEGAEAKYRVIEYDFLSNKDDVAEEACYSFIESNSPHIFWIAKTYILLARIYYKAGDNFSAIGTLENITKNYPVETDAIKTEAKELINKINTGIDSQTIEKSYKNNKGNTSKEPETNPNQNANPDNNDNYTPTKIE